jgi:hypothetical protein
VGLQDSHNSLELFNVFEKISDKNLLVSTVLYGTCLLETGSEGGGGGHFVLSVTGVLDEPYSQLIPLSRLAVQASQSIGWNRVHPM